MNHHAYSIPLEAPPLNGAGDMVVGYFWPPEKACKCCLNTIAQPMDHQNCVLDVGSLYDLEFVV
jgi:hypothetical protein